MIRVTLKRAVLQAVIRDEATRFALGDERLSEAGLAAMERRITETLRKQLQEMWPAQGIEVDLDEEPGGAPGDWVIRCVRSDDARLLPRIEDIVIANCRGELMADLWADGDFEMIEGPAQREALDA